ncbi:multidrug efflux transporter AcrB transmembrane domain-containing protein, partial [Sistotremastrum niveocremeum HHB9708]
MDLHERGRCSMRGSCGFNNGKPLPCPDNGLASEPEDDDARSLLVQTCGADYAEGSVCCTNGQVEALSTNFQQVTALISTCPACWNNFRDFFCSFTCSPDQSTFLNVTSVKGEAEKAAVKSVDFLVESTFGEGFYGSCQYVQAGISNSFALDLMAPGAKDYKGLFAKLGQESVLGSPFQINFPESAAQELAPLNLTPRSCTDSALDSRCPCVDCPAVCPTLPDLPPPGSESSCSVGSLSCLSFVLVLVYSLATAGFLAGYTLQLTLRKRRERRYQRIALSTDTASDNVLSPVARSRGLVGASSLTPYSDGDNSLGGQSGQSESRHLGRGASLLDPHETLQPRQYRLNTILRRAFYRLGVVCAGYPWATFAVMFTLVGLLNLGWQRFDIETDPVRLWVGPSSDSKIQKEYFDEHFGPFYRPEQIFVTAGGGSQDVPALSWDRLKWWLGVEDEIRRLRSSPNGYTLSDVCFKPAGPEGACVAQSVTAWFDRDLDNLDPESWKEQLTECAKSPVSCLPDFMQPLDPAFVLGGTPEDLETGEKRHMDSRSLVITYVVNDSLDPAKRSQAEEWERSLRAYLTEVARLAPQTSQSEVVFSTGVSLEEEINKSSNLDTRIVILSYVIMFLYISVALGGGSADPDRPSVWQSVSHSTKALLYSLGIRKSNLPPENTIHYGVYSSLSNHFVTSKALLGLFAIGLVVLSVSSSVGFFSAIGVKVTLIIAEVIPFLVLAVGVDNIFILVHELDRQNIAHGPNSSTLVPDTQSSVSPINFNERTLIDSSREHSVDADSLRQHLSPEERVARALAKMGPSILLSSLTEIVAFALGALVPMPAVRNFSLYAAGSVLLNAILQVTVFISALVLDLRRTEANRLDCFPCIKVPSRIALVDNLPLTNQGAITRFFRRYYAPYLLKRPVKSAVLVFFSGVFVASIISIQGLHLGFDQRLALPSDSYLVPYFNAVDDLLQVGPPVYFVAKGVDVTQRKGQQLLCNGFTTCRPDSIGNILEAERKRPASSFITQPTASWVDDFLKWLNPQVAQCCRVLKRDPSTFCGEKDRPRLCRACYEDAEPGWNITMDGLPEGPEFMRYLNQWLISPSSQDCPLAGAAPYGTALSLDTDREHVIASHFRTYHAPLKSQDDFINAFTSAHRIADDLTRKTGVEVFPYSLFYVFFDQYAHIIGITEEVLGLGLASVLIVTAALLGSWRTGAIVTCVVALTVINVMGVMSIWGIMLNAISLVNLVISLGIAVEFCSHIARAFMGAGAGLPNDHPGGQKERDERTWVALTDVGPAVLSGITFTKLIGMSVLALTKSRLLEIYYFRMWLTLIISGAMHGLILLPVVLSLVGGQGYALEDADEEWMTNVTRRHAYEYRPFVGDDDDS